MYKISVIIPIYNDEKYLANCIEHVINQTIGFENVQLILIDDNSKDKSYEIAKSYKDKYDNILLEKLTTNSGSGGKPRNVGINLAEGKYLMFSDQILSTFFVACVNKKKYDSINNLLNHLSFEIKNNNYNFTFEANNLRIVARFIEYVFNKENEDNKNVQYFIQNCFLSFFDTILSLLYDVKDKRENKIFEEVLIIAIAKGLQKKKNEKIENKDIQK